VVLVFVGLRSGRGGRAARGATRAAAVGSTTTVVPAALPVSQVRALEAALVSQNAATFRSILAPPLRSALRGSALSASQLPAGSTVAIDGGSAVISGNTMTVDARVAGPRPSPFRLFLVRDGANWLLLGTEQRR
jgi:hypothetical protein